MPRTKVKDFTPNELKFIEWLACPGELRSPPTQELFAKSINVSHISPVRWKKKDGLLDAVNNRARELFGERLPNIYAALGREAEKGSFPHIKLSMEMLGEHTDKVEVINWRDLVPEDSTPDSVQEQFKGAMVQKQDNDV